MRVRQLVTDVADGVGGVVLVTGEQGIGKTALLRAGLSGAAERGCRMLWGAADDIGQRFPLRLMAECLGPAAQQAAAGGVTQLDDGHLPLDDAAAGSGVVLMAGDPVRAGVEDLLAVVERWCTVSPVVLVAEDLQWADEASLLVWQRLGRLVGQLPLLLAGSYRPGAGLPDLTRLRSNVVSRGGCDVALGPLPQSAINELTGELVGGQPGRRLTEMIKRAGGNPLYARELTDGLVRANRVTVEGGVAELSGTPAATEVPVSLAAAIAERLASLPAEAARVLRWASVLGSEFSVPDLLLVTGQSAREVLGVVELAAEAGVVAAAAGPQLGFRHGLIRQVLYEGMPTALRMALHQQMARALADDGAAADRVAGQLMAAGGPTGEGWALDWLAQAAPTLTLQAPQVAADLLREALDQLEQEDHRRPALEMALAQAAFLLDRYEEAEQAGGRALARTAQPGRAAEIAWLIAYARMRTGRAAEAGAAVDQALARLGASAAQTARLRALRALILGVLGRLDEAAGVGRAALAEAEQTGDWFAVGYSLHAMSTISYLRSDPGASLAYLDRALDVIGTQWRVTDVRLVLLFNRPTLLTALDRQAEAIVTAQEALVLAERAGTLRQLQIRTVLAHLYYEAGRWDDALAELELVVGLPGPDYYQLLVHGLLALIAVRRDDLPTARQHLAAVQDKPFLDASYWASSYRLMDARAAAAESDGRPAEAAAVLAQYLDPELGGHAPGRGQLLPLLARLALITDDPATAAAAAEAADADARGAPLAIKSAMAGYCRGLVAGDPAPVLAAAAYLRETSRPGAGAQALEDAAVLAAARGDAPAARVALAAARDLYETLGAQWDLRRASARLRPFGIRLGRRAGRPRPATGWEALTPTEITVARLVATGRSNPDIAAELFLSRNTVQTHVSHVLAKLTARSRAEIIRIVLGRETG